MRRAAARAAILVSRASRVSMISGSRSAWLRIASTMRVDCCWRAVTTVPSPWRTSTTPTTSSATRAWLRVARLTPRRCASSRSGGSLSPAREPVVVDPRRDLARHLLVEAGAEQREAGTTRTWDQPIDDRLIVLLARPLSQARDEGHPRSPPCWPSNSEVSSWVRNGSRSSPWSRCSWSARCCRSTWERWPTSPRGSSGCTSLGLDEKEILGGISADLVLTLIGVTYLFAIARQNGTVDLIVRTAVAVGRRPRRADPVGDVRRHRGDHRDRRGQPGRLRDHRPDRPRLRRSLPASAR